MRIRANGGKIFVSHLDAVKKPNNDRDGQKKPDTLLGRKKNSRDMHTVTIDVDQEHEEQTSRDLTPGNHLQMSMI